MGAEKSGSRKVLVAVLNWGLGHATRTISVIHQLRLMKCEVVIASSGIAGEVLRQEFPDCVYRALPDYEVNYAGGFMRAVLRQSFKIWRAIRSEHREFSAIVKSEQPDLIISDNRYGCYAPDIPSIFICHQPNIPILFFRSLAVRFHSSFLKKFNEVWIPDLPGSVLSGDLSKAVSNLKLRFVGPLSRFEWVNHQLKGEKWYVMGVVSGPEPDRTRFEQRLLHAMMDSGKRCLLVTGIPARSTSEKGSVTILGHLPADQFLQEMNSSRAVIGRSGYSSILDYAVTGVRAILVPTPGQPEQEYLATRASEMKYAVTQSEDAINLENGIVALQEINGFPTGSSSALLSAAIEHWLHIKPS